MKWPVRCDPTDTFGERLVQVAASALAQGTLGQTHRADIYAAFVACGQAQDLSHVKTSCGIFVRACMHWAGRQVPGRGVPGWPLVGAPGASWLGLAEIGAGWHNPALAPSAAMPGAIFIKRAPDHVGILLAELYPGTWATAEGGGGDGTDCKITWRTLDGSFPSLVGIWTPEFIGAGDPPAPPGSAPEAATPALPIVYHDPRPEAAAAWQRRLLAHTPGCLPKYGADGGYGDETATATLAVQRAAGLELDGHRVDFATWAAAS